MLDDLGDIARVSQTCRAIHDLVYKSADSHLWRSLFLARYDDPRSGLGVKSPYDYNWKRAVQARTKAQKVVASSTVTPDHVEAITTLLTLSADAPHGAIVTGRNIPLLHSLITPALYARSDRPLLLSDQALLSPLDASEASAKLSVYLGLGAEPRRTLSRPSQRNGARAIVYDLRTWQEDCLYGPFKPDGTIDWRKAEAILFVACANAIDLVRSLNASARTRLSCHLAGARPYSAPGWDDDSITGDWVRPLLRY